MGWLVDDVFSDSGSEDEPEPTTNEGRMMKTLPPQLLPSGATGFSMPGPVGSKLPSRPIGIPKDFPRPQPGAALRPRDLL
jgi:hypothetical protein